MMTSNQAEFHASDVRKIVPPLTRISEREKENETERGREREVYHQSGFFFELRGNLCSRIQISKMIEVFRHNCISFVS